MAPAPKTRAGKKGDADKGPLVRKSVDGDGCWDVERNVALDCFEFVGAKGAPARAGEGGSESAVLRNRFAGQWRTILGEQCYLTGVHYLAVRVEGFSRNGLPTPDVGSSWFVGVGSRNCPLNGDLSELAYVELDSWEGLVVQRPQEVPTAPKLWALGLANYTQHPLGPGKIIAAPACIYRAPPRVPGAVMAAKGGSIAAAGAGPLSLEPVALLAHNCKVHSGDVIGIRIDVDAATVGFWLNKSHVKDVHLNVDCGSWGALASTSDSRVKFTLLTKQEQREAAIWDEEARQEIEEAPIAGSRALGSSGRSSECKVLTDALSNGHVHEAQQALLLGIAPTQGWLELLSPQGVLMVRKTVRALMGSSYRVKPGGVTVPMFQEKQPDTAAAARSAPGTHRSVLPGGVKRRGPVTHAGAAPGTRIQSPVSPKEEKEKDAASSPASEGAGAGPPGTQSGRRGSVTSVSSKDGAGEGGEGVAGAEAEVKAAKEEPEHVLELYHPVFAREEEMREAASKTSSALAVASARMQELRRQELTLKNSMRELEEGFASYAASAATDFSVAVTHQKERRRIQQMQAEMAASVSAGAAAVERLKLEAKLAKFHAAQATAQARRLALRRDAGVLDLYGSVRSYLAANTTRDVTFSAPDKHAAAQAVKDVARGNFRGPNETLAALVEPHTGNVVVILMTATPGARIFYSLEPWGKDGNPPRIDERSASCTSGGKVTLTKTGNVTAFASYGSILPSETLKSPLYTVRCAAPAFIGTRSGDKPLKIQLKCATPGSTIYWTFNSLPSTPDDLAIEGGEPLKEEPWGTGKGKRDGSQPLPSKFMAGAAKAFEYIDIMTSGKITAIASKDGLQDSLTAVSDDFTIAGR